MRMWNVDTKLLCRQHLLGEHNEVHAFVGTINKGISIKGYINNGLVDVYGIRFRHLQLEREMIRRGYKHNSPLPKFDAKQFSYPGIVDVEANLVELKKRCQHCLIK